MMIFRFLLVAFWATLVAGWVATPLQGVSRHHLSSSFTLPRKISNSRVLKNAAPVENESVVDAVTKEEIIQKDDSTVNNDDDSDSTDKTTTTTFQTIFDFAQPDTVDKIERLDDAIMGGISTSTVVDATNTDFARWTGVCRTDGGGFCGYRTNPFEEPLLAGDSDGYYVKCRLASDNEPERRIWKMTTRTKPDRGELLYQAPFDLAGAIPDEHGWCTVKVPFDSFMYVRGPRVIPDGPPLDISGGLYQIGMTMSKFAFGTNTTELKNFKDGFFELQLREIGLYKEQASMTTAISAPKIYTKEEAKQKRSLVVKLLKPISKIFFSESSNRRKSAMKILRQKRGLSRVGAILFGWRNRAKSFGIVQAMAKTLYILAADVLRTITLTTLRITILYPVKVVRKLIGAITGKKPTPIA